ncbi:MAG: two-component regulator propeller domain-containing protein, partial [Bacteroidota bacterium]
RDGQAVPFTGSYIHLDTMPGPLRVPANPPTKVDFRQNKYRAIWKDKLFEASFLRKTLWGSNGVPLPEKVTLIERTFLATPSSPKRTAPLGVRDQANHDIRFLDVDQGLNSSFIHAIHEDSRGYLWIGGWTGGLGRYDGVSVIDYNDESNGWASDEINSILEDHTGQLWIGHNGGFTVFDGTSFTHYAFNGVEIEGVTSLLEDQAGQIWIIVKGYGLLRYASGDFELITEKNGLPSNQVDGIAEDSTGRVWVTTPKGLGYFVGQSFTELTLETGRPPRYKGQLFADSAGNVWLLTEDGFCRFDGRSFRYVKWPPALENTFGASFAEDKSGDLWIGTENDGVFLFDGTFLHQYSEKEGLSISIVNTLLVGSQGQLWIGTNGAGLNRLNRSSFAYILPELGEKSFLVNRIYEDRRGRIWLGTDFHGLLMYNDGELYHFGS